MDNSVLMSSHCWYVGDTRHLMVLCCKESSLSLTESVAAVIEVVSPSLSELTASSSLSELTASSSLSQVWELTANNVIMVSAIGNDGPLYG